MDEDSLSPAIAKTKPIKLGKSLIEHSQYN